MSDDYRGDPTELGPVARRLAASQRVLMFEDEADIALFLRAYFRASGYDLVHVDPDDVESALAALDEYEPDLLLLDLRLRGFRGEDVYRALRADERWAFMPVVVVSADAPAGGAIADGSSGGLDAHVTKPFNTDLLAETVRDHLARAEQLAKVGIDEELGVMAEDYLRTRLIDEVNSGREYGVPFTFALVQLLSLDVIHASLGPDGSAAFLRKLVDRARVDLPDPAVIGVTGEDEVAVILPELPVDKGARVLEEVVGSLSGTHEMAGGARFPVDLAVGIAGFPDNAADPDELYMAADGALEEARSGDHYIIRAY